MTDPNRTYLGILVDRSGSMQDLAVEATNSIKRLIAEQQEEPGELDVALWEFDDYLAEVPPADVEAWRLIPRGMTALHDALGQMIKIIGTRLAGFPEDQRPGKVIIQITTDGGENSSEDYTGPAVARMIQHQTTEYGWHFLYSGTNQDAIGVARNLNIPMANAHSYAPTASGIAQTYAVAGGAMSAYRKSSS